MERGSLGRQSIDGKIILKWIRRVLNQSTMESSKSTQIVTLFIREVHDSNLGYDTDNSEVSISFPPSIHADAGK
jgi:hypothetical protein